MVHVSLAGLLTPSLVKAWGVPEWAMMPGGDLREAPVLGRGWLNTYLQNSKWAAIEEEGAFLFARIDHENGRNFARINVRTGGMEEVAPRGIAGLPDSVNEIEVPFDGRFLRMR